MPRPIPPPTFPALYYYPFTDCHRRLQQLFRPLTPPSPQRHGFYPLFKYLVRVNPLEVNENGTG